MITEQASSSFSLRDLLGQKTASQYLENYSKHQDKIPPLLIFYGPSGVGKWFAAERFARTILCLNQNSCGSCISCRTFMKNTHPDFILFPEGEKIAIGESKDPKEFTIRWLQNQRIIYPPSISPRRVVLIPDANKINGEAETSMLKTLEEAPHHTRFIFIVEDIHSLKSTIISRAILIPFGYLSSKTLNQINSEQNIILHDQQAGSFDYHFLDPIVWAEYKDIVQNKIFDSRQLLDLELWIREHKVKHPEWPDEFDYTKFLELITSIMIHEYRKNMDKDYSESIIAVFEFKEMLHRQFNGMENFILSQLFSKLCSLNK
ncbi:hypothetical protein [Leptospira sp. GIMC2001]|uniref:hypothetical protein n=1 Tax=Leptospira sp. GIMC2001 TaxID=1513297 RepID=UPI0004A5C363|nr:hypothetical protein [Leptospira sp. GIMC2001]AID56283.1 DNA polymerase III delta prime subunit [Leptospira sp. GIMC2001]WCL49521.1 hypothetical protein O4O04_19885 [Leptospira sp. GIMC2001]